MQIGIALVWIPHQGKKWLFEKEILNLKVLYDHPVRHNAKNILAAILNIALYSLCDLFIILFCYKKIYLICVYFPYFIIHSVDGFDFFSLLFIKNKK